ncbi:hypothetical protein KP509_01G103900 [Ceratopteris richardii]|nr:hypothetical protein KP509_01G103900 [Ceratopteris richardii]
MDWTALATEASCVFSDGPGLQTMLGPMDSEPKKRKAMAPRRRDRGPAAQTVRPETVIEEGGDKQSQTDKAIRTMFNVLRRCGEGGCELEQLVLSRDSFAHTVENIFCLSFLVKDGRAQISIQDGKHIVAFKYAPTAAERSGGSHGGDHEQVVNTQFVFRFDFKDWTLMKEAVEPGEELMPKRTQQMSDPQIPTPIRKNSRNRGRVTTSDQHGLMAEMGADDVDECQGQDHENDCAETDRIKRPTKKRIL